MTTSRKPHTTILILLAAFASSLIAQPVPTPFETLDSVVARTPDEAVTVVVKFNSIQREPSVTAMLVGARLQLEELHFKFVGSGGGSASSFDPAAGQLSMLGVAETFSQARQQHRMFFLRMMGTNEPDRSIPCPIDDADSPVIDTHGIPGDPLVELACGLRISGLKLSGTAEAAAAFRDALSAIAEVTREPSLQEIRAQREALQQLRLPQ